VPGSASSAKHRPKDWMPSSRTRPG
jgi:hypothetical protein